MYTLRDTRTELRDGKSCLKDLPELTHCTWGIELLGADRWGNADQFLLVVVRATHDGPGTWDTVFMYACGGQTFVPVFAESYLGGGKVELRTPLDMLITTAVWLRRDPGCCPSREQTSHYRWRASEKRFVRIGLREAPVRTRTP